MSYPILGNLYKIRTLATKMRSMYILATMSHLLNFDYLRESLERFLVFFAKNVSEISVLTKN